MVFSFNVNIEAKESKYITFWCLKIAPFFIILIKCIGEKLIGKKVFIPVCSPRKCTVQ
jgi:hypothetical protein